MNKPICAVCHWTRCPTPVILPDRFAGLADVGGPEVAGGYNLMLQEDDPFGGLI